MAGRGGFIIVEVVIPKQLFSGSDVAESKEPRAALDFVDLTVGIAGMVQKRSQPLTIDDCLTVFQTIEVCAGAPS